MKKLFIEHKKFGPNIRYRTWHEGTGVINHMPWPGKIYLLYLALIGWKLFDYDPDGVTFEKK